MAEKEGEIMLEEGHSFVPKPLIDGAVESGRTGADAAAATTHKRVLSALGDDIPEPAKEERAGNQLFNNAFFDLCEGQWHMLPRNFEEMRTTIGSRYIKKETKYEIFRGQLSHSMSRFGLVRTFEPGRIHTGSETNWMVRLGDFLEEVKTYFGDIMSDEDFNYFWRKYIGELALSFYVERGTNEVLWYAKHLDIRMEKIKEVARKYGIITEAQVATFEKQAKIAIARIIIDKITADFYKESGFAGGSDKETIILLARKYDIDLPSEQDFWKEEAKKLIEELEAVVIEIESEKDEPSFKYSIEDRKKRISALRDSLIAGKGKFGEDIFPEEARPFDEWSAGMEARIEAAKRHNLEFLYQDQETKLTATLEGVMASMDVDEARRQFRFFSDFLNEIKTDAARNERISEALRGYLRRIDDRISALIQEIQADATRAKENGKKLTILGNLREIFAENIKE